MGLYESGCHGDDDVGASRPLRVTENETDNAKKFAADDARDAKIRARHKGVQKATFGKRKTDASGAVSLVAFALLGATGMVYVFRH